MERPFERPVPGNGCFRPASAAFLKTVASLRRLVGCWFERLGATPLPGHGIQHPLVSVLLGGVVMLAKKFPAPHAGGCNDVRFGPLADIRDRITDVRFAPNSGHSSVH